MLHVADQFEVEVAIFFLLDNSITRFLEFCEDPHLSVQKHLSSVFLLSIDPRAVQMEMEVAKMVDVNDKSVKSLRLTSIEPLLGAVQINFVSAAKITAIE